MEDQKKTSDQTTSSTTPDVRLLDREPITAAVEGTSIPTAGAAVRQNNPRWWYPYAAGALVLFALGAVWMRLEQEGRVDTSFFSSVTASSESRAVVATINGEKLRNSDLDLSVEQLTQAAAAQGLDPADPAVATEIRSQATQMLINTTLLQQAAADQGIVITDEQLNERIVELETNAGGAELLAERMTEFDIDRETFETDVRTELTILALLDTVFAEADMTVTEEDIVEVYESASAAGAEVPPLDVARPQIEAQLLQGKEQSAVDAFIDELREAADIETN